MTRALTKNEISSLIVDLRRLLNVIEKGEIEASVAMRHRIEGAVVGLKVVQGESSKDALLSFLNSEVGEG